MALFLLLPSLATAADLPTSSPAPIEVVRSGTSTPGAATMGIVLWCEGSGVPTMPRDTSHETDGRLMADVLRQRSDVEVLIVMNDPTADEVRVWFAEYAGNMADEHREVFIAVSCPATGGDSDEEILATRDATSTDGGLSFADLAMAVKPLARSSVWLLDTSRDWQMQFGTTTYGATADDVIKYGLPDILAISSGPPGTYATGGLIAAAASVIRDTKGEPISLDTFFYLGIKPQLATTELQILTSMGTYPGDAWNNNRGRSMFIGGPLIVPVADMPPPVTPKKRRIPPGCAVAGSGVLTLIGASVLAGNAAADYQWMDEVNDGSREATDTELNDRVNRYHLNTGFAIGTGVVGLTALAGGVAWTVLDDNDRKIEVIPTGTGVEVHGTF